MSQITEWLRKRADEIEDAPFGAVRAAAIRDALDAYHLIFPEAAP